MSQGYSEGRGGLEGGPGELCQELVYGGGGGGYQEGCGPSFLPLDQGYSEHGG